MVVRVVGNRVGLGEGLSYLSSVAGAIDVVSMAAGC